MKSRTSGGVWCGAALGLMVVCGSVRAQEAATPAAGVPAADKPAVVDAAAAAKAAEKQAKAVEAATVARDDLTKQSKALDIMKARAKLEEQIDLVVLTQGEIAKNKVNTPEVRSAAKVRLVEEVLHSQNSTLGQRYRALKAMDKGWSIQALTNGFGSLFEDSFDRIDVNVFQPKARIYFDNGGDDAGEIDLFKNGAITPAVEVVELRFLNYISSSRKTAAGFTLSGGIGTPPASDTGATPSSTAPVLLGSIGVLIAHQLDDVDPKQSNAIIGLEAGWTGGVTTDEAIADTTDSAFYIGFGVQLKF